MLGIRARSSDDKGLPISTEARKMGPRSPPIRVRLLELRQSRLSMVLACLLLVVALYLIGIWVASYGKDRRAINRLEILVDDINPFFHIVALQYNSADVLPMLTKELFRFTDIVGAANVKVTMLENGSKDNSKALLKEFQTKLTERKILNNIMLRDAARPKDVDRIQYLVDLRNQVLDAALVSLKGERRHQNEWIIYLNDIVSTAGDLARLVTTRHMNYDMVCAMDFYYSFYDQWVTRDITGLPFSSWYPYVRDPNTADLARTRAPIPVFSCWNGVVVMNAAPFRQGLRFRDTDYRTECNAQSECLTICRDLRLNNFTSIWVNPDVRVNYIPRLYYLHKYILSPLEALVAWFAGPAPPIPDNALRAADGVVCGFQGNFGVPAVS